MLYGQLMRAMDAAILALAAMPSVFHHKVTVRADRLSGSGMRLAYKSNRASFVAEQDAMNSASVVDSATVVCR
ncbi:hypothetical protein EVAR_99433_1 [Eumeta japonica]|uniref:Uncharacterized protein n=1 Tax=Eumeta variegata TaxID=151549 RepID=A0A4C1SGE5_EUMVA|nr:hypothetical protein EVAR_99433_1 [Eumeta japonica]